MFKNKSDKEILIDAVFFIILFLGFYSLINSADLGQDKNFRNMDECLDLSNETVCYNSLKILDKKSLDTGIPVLVYVEDPKQSSFHYIKKILKSKYFERSQNI